jgi:hypothetical protein
MAPKKKQKRTTGTSQKSRPSKQASRKGRPNKSPRPPRKASRRAPASRKTTPIKRKPAKARLSKSKLAKSTGRKKPATRKDRRTRDTRKATGRETQHKRVKARRTVAAPPKRTRSAQAPRTRTKDRGTRSTTQKHSARSRAPHRPNEREVRQQVDQRTVERDNPSQVIRFLDEQGVIAIKVRSARARSRVAEYLNALKSFSTYGLPSVLKEFKGEFVMASGIRHPFITDPDLLQELGNAGELEFEEMYPDTI